MVQVWRGGQRGTNAYSFIAPRRRARSRAASPCTGGLLSKSLRHESTGRVGVGASSLVACGQWVVPDWWFRTGAKADRCGRFDAVWSPNTDVVRWPPAIPGDGRLIGAVANDRVLPAPALASGDAAEAELGKNRVPLTGAGALVIPAGGAGAGAGVGVSAIAPPRRHIVSSAAASGAAAPEGKLVIGSSRSRRGRDDDMISSSFLQRCGVTKVEGTHKSTCAVRPKLG